ncbi:MAG: GIY-YIG nuclease family protein [Paludibacter sp.]|nr:GIY-YIG nuclease family protein [Paludibacter sp.]
MRFIDVIRNILKSNIEGLSPQKIREIVKNNYSEYFGTESHISNVNKGHYKDLDHALLAQIYIATRSVSDIEVDRSCKPIVLRYSFDLNNELIDSTEVDNDYENLDKLEAGIGSLYILGTNLYDKNGFEILKIGITTGLVSKRIDQLYTTGVPLKFREIRIYETKNYAELELSLHKLLSDFRINASREFFTNKCLPYVDKIIDIHELIQKRACG